MKFVRNIFGMSRSSTQPRVDMPLIDYLKEMEGRLTKAQSELEGRLTIAQSELEGRLTIAQSELEGRLTKAQTALKDDIKSELKSSVDKNYWKLVVSVCGATIAGMAIFEGIGGKVLFPWKH